MRRGVAVGVLVVLCLCLPAFAGAQTAVGVKGGLAVSNITGDSEEQPDWLFGWSAGGFVGIHLAPGLYLQPEVLYTRKGSKLTEGGSTAKTNLDYVEIPVLLRLSPEAAKIGFDLFGGIAPALRTRARFVFEGGGELDGLEDLDTDISDLITKWDVGVVVGAGFHLGPVTTEFRWTEGLMNIIENPESGESAKNRSISVLIGFRM